MFDTPIQLIGILTYKSASAHLSRQICKSAEMQVSFLLNKLEDNLDTVFYQSSTLPKADNQLIHRYLVQNKDSVDFWVNSRNIMQLLRNFVDNTPLVKDAAIYYPELEIKISSLKGYETMDSDRISKKLDAFRKSGSVTFLNDGLLSIGSVYSPASYFTNQMPSFFTEVELSFSELRQNYLNPLELVAGDCGILIHADEENGLSPILFSTSSSRADDSFSYLEDIPSQNDLLLSKQFRANNQDYFCSIAYSKNLQLGIVYLADYNSLFGDLNRFQIWYVVFFVITVFILLFISISINRTIQKPINSMISGFKEVRHGNLTVQLQTASSMNEFRILKEDFNKTVHRLQELPNIISEQKLYQKEMELKQLQTQIAPHFLFNSFYMLNRMVQNEDNESASALSRYLGDYFQYLTRDKKEIVFLEQEYNHTMAYLHIQEMRFSNRLKLEIEAIPNDFRLIQVPRLIIQPIVENSISHGLQSNSSACIIRLFFQKCEDHLVIVAEDNGNSLSDDKLRELTEALQSDERIETTGIINTHRRLLLLYGTEYGLHLSRSHFHHEVISHGKGDLPQPFPSRSDFSWKRRPAAERMRGGDSIEECEGGASTNGLGGMRTEIHIPLQWSDKTKR